MKTYLTALFLGFFFLLQQTNAQEKPVNLKQINVLITKFWNLKSGETTNKTYNFTDGKLVSIKTSDVTQHFFYNPKGILDRTVKEKVGSNWKEVVTYSYDSENRLIKLFKKYQEGDETITKTVNLTYLGPRIKVLSKRSITKEAIVEDIEYIVENGAIARRVSRDRNQQIIDKKEYVYLNENLDKIRGVFGDKSIKYYSYDDKNSADLMIIKNMFGDNYKIIVPIISFHEEEFNFQMISQGNEISYKSTTAIEIVRSGKFKYNPFNYPESYSLSEDNGMVKTVKTYIYE